MSGRVAGTGERGLELMAARAGARRAFGGPVAANASFQATLASRRIQLDAARLTVLDAAHALDLHGAKQVRWVAAESSSIKAVFEGTPSSRPPQQAFFQLAVHGCWCWAPGMGRACVAPSR